MKNRLRGTGRAVVETLREWIAGLGFFGALIAGVSIFAENVQGTLPGVAGWCSRRAVSAAVLSDFATRADEAGCSRAGRWRSPSRSL